MKVITTLLFSVALTTSFAQETVSIMYYNLLKFPNVNSGRITYLETVVQHVQPDIFVVNELTSSAGSSSILNNALNTGAIPYAAATYVSGPDDNNMLYYNTDKLGLVDENVIATTLRDINEYVLYYKNPTLTATSDTAYLYVYGLHLKAGTSGSDEVQRASETSSLKAYLNARSNPENTIVGGDFNIYYSSEQAYDNLTATNAANLYDVIGPGNYHNNPLFSYEFTQSTRTASFDGGSTGGMDDRFDMILFSDDMLNGDNGAKYVSGSYTSIGQDGQRWNESLTSPTNTSEPSNVINALYYMSDHLPVYMEIEVGGDLSVEELSNAQIQESINVFPNPSNDFVTVNHAGLNVLSYQVLDMQGRVVLSKGDSGDSIQLDLSEVSSGAYMLRLNSDKGSFLKKIHKN